MAVCMFVEPKHSTHPVTIWWVSSIIFSVRDYKHRMCRRQWFMCFFSRVILSPMQMVSWI